MTPPRVRPNSVTRLVKQLNDSMEKRLASQWHPREDIREARALQPGTDSNRDK